jgi:hypothetical protein
MSRSSASVVFGVGLGLVVAVGSGSCTPRDLSATKPMIVEPSDATSGPAPVAAPTAPDPCATVEEEIARNLEPIAVLAREVTLDSERQRLLDGVTALRACHRSRGGAGAWVLMPEDVEVERFANGTLMSISVPFRPTYLRPDAPLVRAETPMQFSYSPEREDNFENAEDFKIVVQLVDYDKDGNPELVLTTEFQGHEDFSRSHFILGVDDGVVRTYPPLAGVDIERLEDYDGDGRPDVISM